MPVSTHRTLSRPDAVRIEEAGLNALHTLRQLFYDGWLLRVSPGAAKRARSVNPHFGSTLPTAAKIDYCEQVYARHGLPTLFRMTPFAKPADLGATLAARGYEAFGETFVQTLSLDRPPELPDRAGEAMVESADLAAFAGAVGSLRGSTPIQRDGHLERLANSPLQMRHAVVRVDGRIVCTGQVAIEGEIVGLFDVITAPDARGRGYATLACASLLAWAWEHGANTAYLQVSADNAPAIGVYRRLGFATLYTYHYRAREGERE